MKDYGTIDTEALLAELERRAGQELMLEYLLQRKDLPTAKDYIDVNWWGELPEE
jgi:hypothetical protein